MVWVRDRMEVTRATRGLQRRHGRFQVPDGAARQDAISRPRAYFDVDYRTSICSALTDFYQMRGLAPGRPRLGPQRDGVAARPLRRARRFGHGDVRVDRRRAACRGRSLPPTPPRRRAARYRMQGPFSHAHAARADPGVGRRDLRVRSRGDVLRAEPRSSRPTPTSPSRARPPTANGRRCRSASPAATGRRAIACSPAS